jgi:hypothetical protein
MNPTNVFSILSKRKRATGTNITEKARERFFELFNEAIDGIITTRELDEETKKALLQIMHALRIQIETIKRKSENENRRKLLDQEDTLLASAQMFLKTQRDITKIIRELSRTRDALEEIKREEALES